MPDSLEAGLVVLVAVDAAFVKGHNLQVQLCQLSKACCRRLRGLTAECNPA